MRNLPLFALLLATPLAAAPIQHEFLAIDEGMNELRYVNEHDGSHDWIVKIGKEHPRDLQLIGDGRVLLGHDLGYTEYDLATGKVEKDVTNFHDVSSVRRFPNGHTLIVGVDFDRPLPPGKRKSIKVVSQIDPPMHRLIMAEYDADGNQVHRTVYAGDYSRLVRETSRGTFLVACNDIIKEADGDGHFIWTARAKGFLHAWKALRLPNGDTIAAGGYGAFMVEFDPQGHVVRTWGGKGQVPDEVHPYFYATFQILANGDIAAANWQGHGPKNGQKGVQLLEFDPQGKIVWEWDDRAHQSSLQAILVLDGLDTSKLYDERNGVMAPL